MVQFFFFPLLCPHTLFSHACCCPARERGQTYPKNTRTVSGELEPRLVPLPSGEEGVNADELCIWVFGGRSGLLRTSPRSQSQVLGGKRSYSRLLPRRGRCPILLIPPALPRMFAKKKKKNEPLLDGTRAHPGRGRYQGSLSLGHIAAPLGLPSCRLRGWLQFLKV